MEVVFMESTLIYVTDRVYNQTIWGDFCTKLLHIPWGQGSCIAYILNTYKVPNTKSRKPFMERITGTEIYIKKIKWTPIRTNCKVGGVISTSQITQGKKQHVSTTPTTSCSISVSPSKWLHIIQVFLYLFFLYNI